MAELGIQNESGEFRAISGTGTLVVLGAETFHVEDRGCVEFFFEDSEIFAAPPQIKP